MGNLNEMRGIVDEKTGMVYLSVDDLIQHLNRNQPKANEIMPEHVTIDRFINLLISFKAGVIEMGIDTDGFDDNSDMIFGSSPVKDIF